MNRPTLKQVIYRYLSFYPLFILSLIISIGVAVFHIRYTVPKYNASALILVKDAGASQQSNNASKDLVDVAISGGRVNLQNDIMLLQSSTLMNRIVKKNSFNILYYKVGKFVEAEMYQNVPFRLIPESIPDSNTSFSISVTKISKGGGEVRYGSAKEMKFQPFLWNVPFDINGRKLSLVLKDQVWGENENYNVVWKPAKQTSAEISGDFSVGMSGTNNSIIELNLKVENLERGEAILNAICDEFISAGIEKKNKITENTISFIDDRLIIVSQELGGVEGKLQDYRGKSQIVDPAQQSSQSLRMSNDVTVSLRELNVQEQVVEMIRQYFNNPAYEDKLVPSSLGISDVTLINLIAKYNDLHLTKEREAPSIAPGSFVLKDLNTQIANVKTSILELLQNIAKNLKVRENDLRQQNIQYRQVFSSMPGKERKLQEIKRQQSIKEGLYLYLLQKREETALTLSSTLSNYQQIDPATGYGPVEPNKTSAIKFAVLIGLLFPVGFVYIRDLLNDKVSNKNDITSKTGVQITGEIEHVKNINKNDGLEHYAKCKEGIEHQLQIIRTDLSVLNKKRDNNVFLVTSSISGEGKSFVSQNLAAVLAKSGKKTALVEFDLRKRETTSGRSETEQGLSNYLNGQKASLSELFYTKEDISNLHVYPSGPINCDPANLLINDRLPHLFRDLKHQYEYIVVNSAPLGLVSDALILGEYSDLVLYIVRHGYTEKKHLTLIEDTAKTGKLKNICIVVNDVKIGGKYGDYKYGYYRN